MRCTIFDDNWRIQSLYGNYCSDERLTLSEIRQCVTRAPNKKATCIKILYLLWRAISFVVEPSVKLGRAWTIVITNNASNWTPANIFLIDNICSRCVSTLHEKNMLMILIMIRVLYVGKLIKLTAYKLISTKTYF